jgi:hypothetical protein
MAKIAFAQSGSRFSHTFKNPDQKDRKANGFKVNGHNGVKHLAGDIGKKADKRDQENGAREEFGCGHGLRVIR